eukprot:3320839-Prymnesium_polylepis.1
MHHDAFERLHEGGAPDVGGAATADLGVENCTAEVCVADDNHVGLVGHVGTQAVCDRGRAGRHEATVDETVTCVRPRRVQRFKGLQQPATRPPVLVPATVARISTALAALPRVAAQQ